MLFSQVAICPPPPPPPHTRTKSKMIFFKFIYNGEIQILPGRCLSDLTFSVISFDTYIVFIVLGGIAF